MSAWTILTCLSLTAVDGDTVKCDGENFRILGDGAPYESGVDAPEVGRWADCERERGLGEQAKARMSELLSTPGLVVESSGVYDPFDRLLVKLRLPDGGTIGQRLIDEGYAVVWTPGYRDAWCE